MSKLNLKSIKIELGAEDDPTIKQVVAAKITIENLVNECFIMDVEKKKIEKQLKIVKEELKGLLISFDIKKIITDDFTMTRNTSKKFSKWTDEEALMSMIPKKYRGLETMSPSKTKIDALIATNDVSEDILKFAKYSPIDTIKFMPAVEKILTD